MTTYQDSRRVVAGRERRLNSYIFAAILLAAGGAVILFQQQFIQVEAFVTAHAIQPFLFGRTNASGAVFYVGIGTSNVHGFEITGLCSTSILVAPLLGIAGLMQLFPRYRATWVAKGLVIALVIAIAANLLRYALITFAFQTWGTSGFDVMHHYVGSIIVLLCTAGAILLLVVVATRGRLRRRRTSGRHGRA